MALDLLFLLPASFSFDATLTVFRRLYKEAKGVPIVAAKGMNITPPKA